jgi:parallel beta-helix repeat protein
MRKTGKVLAVLIAVIFLSSIVVFQPATVKAQSKTIIVPDDYSTITFAIGNATSGDTILVKNGNYTEHSIVIDKTISLIGENSNHTIITNIDKPVQFLGSSMFIGPTAIGISADYVRISGFTISSSGTAIGGGGFKTLITENKLGSISLDKGSYQTIAGNTITSINCQAPFTCIVNNSLVASYTVLTVQTPSSNNVIYNNKLVGFNATSNLNVAGIDGIGVYDSDNNLIAKNDIANCSVGIHVDSSHSNNIVANRISNGFVGLAAIRESSDNIFYANTVASNTAAISVAGTNNRLYGNSFLNNLQPVESADKIWGPNPSSSITLWYNGQEGNYWSDHKGTDANGDGIGDSPYVVDSNNSDPYPLMNPLNVDSLAVELPEWAVIQLSELDSNIPLFPVATPSSGTSLFNPLITIAIIVIPVFVILVSLLLYRKRHRKT